MFEVTLSTEAREFYESADRALAQKLAPCFAQLERDPHRHNNIKRLTGALSRLVRYRVGDWLDCSAASDRSIRYFSPS
jgi:mRNA interferase RelE/StbE